MRRFTRFYCCAALAPGFVSSSSIAGPLASAASEAFRRLPQSAPSPVAPANQPATAPASAAPIEPSSASSEPPVPNSTTYGSSVTWVSFPSDFVVQGPAPHQVPEPGVLGLLAAGGAGLALARRRRK